MLHALLLTLALLVPKPVTQDFATDLVKQLSTMLNTPAPKSISIEIVRQEALQARYRGQELRDCLRANGLDQFPMCSQYADSLRTFIYGTWAREGGPDEFHILIYDRAGIEVYIHEYLHWWLHYRSNPPGLINTEATVEQIKRSIMLSEEFQEWLGRQK